ncbi:MAG: hypothetical protein ACK55Z_09040, partial [bacterium]
MDSEEAQWLAKQVGSRLPPGWGATWTERGCGEFTGTRTDQRQLVVKYLRAMEVGCVECQVRYRGMSRVSAQVVYTLSTRQGGVRRVRSPTNAHGGSRGKWSEG